MDMVNKFLCHQPYIWAFFFSSFAFGYQPSTVPQEICDREIFKAECGNDEMIMVSNATYGRMRINRCIKKDFGYIGCKSDVLQEMHRLCSGRQKCEFVTSDLFKSNGNQACISDLTAYLEIIYSCVKVVTCDSSLCQKSDFLRVSPPSGLFTSETTWRTGCGTASCPWVIQGEKGQRINFTLYDFSKGREEDRPDRLCYKYATIEEESSITKDITACLGDGNTNTKSHVFLSESNSVAVKIYAANDPEQLLHFALKYEVLGCPLLYPPRFSTLRHDGNIAIITCNNSDTSWRLTCNGKAWVGQMGSCVDTSETVTSGVVFSNDRQAYGMLLIVGLGIAIGVIIGGLLLAVSLVYIKKKKVPTATLR